eukprot:symbB.v1.2.000843.t1/scaffold37.1/size397765/15
MALNALLPPDAPENPNANLLPSFELSKDKRIVIVGGGPAGIHMSAILAAAGYKHVTLLEAENEVGGKSLTIFDPSEPDVPQEMGTCYLTPMYTLFRKVMNYYDPENGEIEFSGDREVFGVVVPDEEKRKYTEGMSYGDWVNAVAERICCPSWLWCCPDSCCCITVNAAFLKYLKLHNDIFGYYSYGMPPKPKDWSKINMTASEFLKQNGIEVLEPIFIYSQQVQGYGLLDSIPAFYLLWWNHPDVVRETLKSIFGLAPDVPGLGILKKGFQSVWKHIKEKHSSEVNYITGARVTEIKRLPTVEVKYIREGREYMVQGDIFINAVSLYQFRHLIKDLDPEEEAIFSKLTQSTITTTLYKGKAVPHEHSVEIWFGRMGYLTPSGVGQFYCHRNSRLATDSPQVAPDGRELRVAYQYMTRPKEVGDEEKLAVALKEGLKTYAGEPEVEIVLQKVWTYMPRFQGNGLVEECPWKILSLQGQRNTFYIGSSVCFESALDQVTYNIMLGRKITGITAGKA